MLSALLLLGLGFTADLDAPPKYKAWVQDHEIWIQAQAGDRRVVYDALAADPVAASPEGDRVVYAQLNPLFDAPHCGNTPQKFLVLVKANGEQVWKVGFEEACQDFQKFEWIDNHRIGAMLCGRANCFYWIVDAGSGKVSQRLADGFDFLWSHNRKWVAHRQLGLGYEEGDGLMFNSDHIVYPQPWPRTGYRNIGYLTWSPDDKWLSFGEMDHPSYDSYLVLVSPEGEVVREDLPADVQDDSRVTWTDNSHGEITTSRGALKFEVQGNTLHEVAEPKSN
jgi:hypothetical protein